MKFCICLSPKFIFFLIYFQFIISGLFSITLCNATIQNMVDANAQIYMYMCIYIHQYHYYSF